ncbi:MAG: hypothetical protein K0R38_632 [Polyangiaceae bacterium]|nr:hypothetical protein [Polyangiaceae bacterium]
MREPVSALKVAIRGSSRRGVVLAFVAATTGLGVGWFLPAGGKRSFAYLYALLVPALIAIACARAVTVTTKRHRWVVPVFLALAIVNVINRPHLPTLSALSIGAAAVATLAAVGDRRVTAVVAIVVACAAISASLLLGLRTT